MNVVSPPPRKILTASSDGRPHFRYLDSLRALAALYVVVHHAKMTAYHGMPSTKMETQLLGVFHWGHQAVDLFIVLSGFCLMLPVVRSGGMLRSSVWGFYYKRARRILPPYLFAVGLSLLLIALVLGHKTGTLWDTAIPVTQAGVITHLLLLQDLFAGTATQINHVLWSVSVEWRIYFLFPLLVLGQRRLGPFKTTFVAVVCSYLLLFALEFSPLQVDPNAETGIMPQYLGLFALGTFGAGVAFSEDEFLSRIRRATPWACLALGLFLVAFAGLGLHWHGERLSLAVDDLIMGSGMAALLVLSSQQNRVHRFLSWKPLAFLGTFAFSLYLIHPLLLQLLWQYPFRSLHDKPSVLFLCECVIGLPIIIGASYLFFLAFERPFLNRRTDSVSPLRKSACSPLAE